MSVEGSVRASVTVTLADSLLELLRASEADRWRVEQVTAVVAAVAEDAERLRRTAVAARVDRDRGIAAADLRAQECETHGQEVRFQRHQAHYLAVDAHRREAERNVYMAAVRSLGHSAAARRGEWWADRILEYTARIERDADAARRRATAPSHAECQRAGHCDHPDTPPHAPCERLRSEPDPHMPVQLALFADLDEVAS